MKTHKARVTRVALLAALALPPAGAQELSDGVSFDRGTGMDDLARLEDRIADLEARIAAIERGERALHTTGGEAVDRVAVVADRAMRRLVGMVRGWKRGGRDDAL